MMLTITDTKVDSILRQVTDPEIPVLSIMDMGIIREVIIVDTEVTIDIIPTYSGCPAMDTIADDIKHALSSHGYKATVNLILSPPWTTDLITDNGRRKLQEYGIAAPMDAESDKKALLEGKKIIKCTNCNSSNTRMISQFGSTACKALFQCNECLEPFDYFKCLK